MRGASMRTARGACSTTILPATSGGFAESFTLVRTQARLSSPAMGMPMSWLFLVPAFGFASKNFYAEFLAALYVAEHAEQPPHLDQGLAAGRLDRDHGLAGLLGLAVEHVGADPRLHRDDAHAVRHHVVQLAGDPQPLLRRIDDDAFASVEHELLDLDESEQGASLAHVPRVDLVDLTLI